MLAPEIVEFKILLAEQNEKPAHKNAELVHMNVELVHKDMEIKKLKRMLAEAGIQT